MNENRRALETITRNRVDCRDCAYYRRDWLGPLLTFGLTRGWTYAQCSCPSEVASFVQVAREFDAPWSCGPKGRHFTPKGVRRRGVL